MQGWQFIVDDMTCIAQDKNYAFVEFRSVEEASNCMAFDGLAFKDGYLRVCRFHTHVSR